MGLLGGGERRRCRAHGERSVQHSSRPLRDHRISHRTQTPCHPESASHDEGPRHVVLPRHSATIIFRTATKRPVILSRHLTTKDPGMSSHPRAAARRCCARVRAKKKKQPLRGERPTAMRRRVRGLFDACHRSSLVFPHPLPTIYHLPPTACHIPPSRKFATPFPQRTPPVKATECDCGVRHRMDADHKFDGLRLLLDPPNSPRRRYVVKLSKIVGNSPKTAANTPNLSWRSLRVCA